MDYVVKSQVLRKHGYNGRNEVVSARRMLGGESVAGFNEDFAYDPIGNRISSTAYDETGAARHIQLIILTMNSAIRSL